MVVAPRTPLPHAPPSPAVLRVGLSVVALARPVPFGHPQNDPVTLVVALAAPDKRSHTQALATLAGLLAEETRRAALLRAERPEEILAAVEAYEDCCGGPARAASSGHPGQCRGDGALRHQCPRHPGRLHPRDPAHGPPGRPGSRPRAATVGVRGTRSADPGVDDRRSGRGHRAT